MPFTQIPRSYYLKLPVPTPNGIEIYRSANPIMRTIFWQRLRRIEALFRRLSVSGNCLDFGGGSGAFLPTLSKHFSQVDCIDLEPGNAVSVVKDFSLGNVRILREDVSGPARDAYSAIVAADVLEHFQDLAMPIDAIKRRLRPNGVLFTSLPTENWLYVLLRLVLGVQKPSDHYHSAHEVETRLRAEGFAKLATRCVPWGIPVPLFLVSAWRLNGS